MTKKEYTEAEVRLIIDGAIAEEREACAKVCEEWGAFNKIAADCAEAIRARGLHNMNKQAEQNGEEL
jgi:hypothetical protein